MKIFQLAFESGGQQVNFWGHMSTKGARLQFKRRQSGQVEGALDEAPKMPRERGVSGMILPQGGLGKG